MAILQSCCCWRSVRKGSYASAFYTMVYFSIITAFVGQFLHEERNFISNKSDKAQSSSILEPESITRTTIGFSILVLTCAACGILATLLLLYGLYSDNRFLLLPWIITTTGTTLADLGHMFYIFVMVTLRFHPLSAIILTVDFFILCLNVYSILCVVSQYQEFRAGRGTAAHDREAGGRQVIPSVQYTAPTTTTATSCISGGRRGISSSGGTTKLAISPTRSPSGGLTTQLMPDSAPSSRPSSRKHVQFPTVDNDREQDPSLNNGAENSWKGTPSSPIMITVD